MKPWMMLCSILMVTAAFATAQAPEPKPAPGHTDGILGPELIAWSELQKPQPVPQQPQPVPPPDTQPAQQPSDQTSEPDHSSQPDAKQSREPDTEESATKSVTGTVAKVSGKYVLQTADNVEYQLDNPDKTQQYVGKRVKVTGSLDRSTGILHVSSIELLS